METLFVGKDALCIVCNPLSFALNQAWCLQTVFQQNQHVSKFDYDEIGPTAIHRKL